VNTLLSVLQHALGRDEFGQRKKHLTEDHRNHYVASEGHHSYHLCREAVALGFMEAHKATDISGGDKWFHVTDAGIKHVDETSPKPPKKTRGQLRYLRFLEVSDMDPDLTFRDFVVRAKEFGA
jgi:hypothetical protein